MVLGRGQGRSSLGGGHNSTRSCAGSVLAEGMAWRSSRRGSMTSLQRWYAERKGKGAMGQLRDVTSILCANAPLKESVSLQPLDDPFTHRNHLRRPQLLLDLVTCPHGQHTHSTVCIVMIFKIMKEYGCHAPLDTSCSLTRGHTSQAPRAASKAGSSLVA